MKDFIEIHGKDARDFLISTPIQNLSDKIIFNIDPPYVKKGPALYENCFNDSDHASLSKIIKMLPTKWIVTYDEHPLIHQLYSDFRMNNFFLHYSAGISKMGTELIIYSNNLNIEP